MIDKWIENSVESTTSIKKVYWREYNGVNELIIIFSDNDQYRSKYYNIPYNKFLEMYNRMKKPHAFRENLYSWFNREIKSRYDCIRYNN